MRFWLCGSMSAHASTSDASLTTLIFQSATLSAAWDSSSHASSIVNLSAFAIHPPSSICNACRREDTIGRRCAAQGRRAGILPRLFLGLTPHSHIGLEHRLYAKVAQPVTDEAMLSVLLIDTVVNGNQAP